MEEPSTTSIIKDDPTTIESGKADPTEASSDSIGFLIHPTIMTAHREFKDLRIAQIGIGNSMSMIYAWRQTPGRGTIDGYDVDISHAMPIEWRSSNLKIRRQDISRLPLHSSQLKCYNIVHLRFAASLVRSNNPDFLIENAVAMLKPGGWIQWDEIDLASASVVTTNKQPTSLFPNAEALARLTREEGAETHGWLSHLPLLFMKYGLDAMNEVRRPIKLEHVTESTEMLVLAWEEEMRSLRKDGDEEEKVRRGVLEGALRGFEEESLRAGRGVAVRMDRYIGLARKAEKAESGVPGGARVEEGWVADDDGITATKVVGGKKT